MIRCLSIFLVFCIFSFHHDAAAWGTNYYVIVPQPGFQIPPMAPEPDSNAIMNGFLRNQMLMQQMQMQRQMQAQQQRQPAPDPRVVAHVQGVLARLGYDPGPIDGHAGPRTNQAFQNYTRDSGKGPQEALLFLMRQP